MLKLTYVILREVPICWLKKKFIDWKISLIYNIWFHIKNHDWDMSATNPVELKEEQQG